MIVNSNRLSKMVLILKILTASVLILIWAAGCSSTSSETPEKFVLKFIQKHVRMVDRSVADFYVREERPGVIDRVEQFVTAMKKKRIFKSLNSATYDFSNIRVNVLDQKEEYVNDEPVNFVKVAVRGNYTKTINGKTESVTEDEMIILESVAGQWKVTEKTDPWG